MGQIELSDGTKVKIAGDLLRHYYKHIKEDSMKKVKESLEKIKEIEPYYYKVIEFMYLNNWSIRKSSIYLHCSEPTVERKRNKLLLLLYEMCYGGEN